MVSVAESVPEQYRPKVLLFSMPWMKGTWPCLGIAALKSHLASAGYPVVARHLHLDAAARLGLSSYDALAETWGAGEALFGALLDPADGPRLRQFAADKLRLSGFSDVADWALGPATDQLSSLVDYWIDDTRALDFAVVGGSIGALQLCSTLFLMKRLHDRGHRGTRLLGGAGLVGSVSSVILERAPFIDFVVNGEGEDSLLNLVGSLHRGVSPNRVQGVVYRDTVGVVRHNGRGKSIDLSTIETPDLSDFFEAAEQLKVPSVAITLSFEHSRGCEWEHRTPGNLRGCTFCGLYRVAESFRRKPLSKLGSDIKESVSRYRNLNLAFVDAYLPEEGRSDLLDLINAFDADVTYFSELRCDLDQKTVGKLKARARRVQLGVESFSTEILRRIEKGVTGAQSVYCLRMCLEAGIPTQYNLMTHIPGVTSTEVSDLRALLPVLFGLPPPKMARFYLDRNSLIYASPERYGLDKTGFDLARHEWLPQSLGDGRISQVVTFVSSDVEVDGEWRLIEEVVDQWRLKWRQALDAGLPSTLTWSRGTDWVSIVDMRGDAVQIYQLDGLTMDVFLYVDEITTPRRICERFASNEQAHIEQALEELAKRGLVFIDGSRITRTAVRRGSSG